MSAPLFILVAFLATLGGSQAMKCYNCTSDVTPGCTDPFKGTSSSIPTCTGTWCGKASYHGTNLVVRLCEQSTVPPDTCATVTVAGLSFLTCICSGGDYCNSAPGGLMQQRAAVYAALAASAAVLLFTKLQG